MVWRTRWVSVSTDFGINNNSDRFNWRNSHREKRETVNQTIRFDAVTDMAEQIDPRVQTFDPVARRSPLERDAAARRSPPEKVDAAGEGCHRGGGGGLAAHVVKWTRLKTKQINRTEPKFSNRIGSGRFGIGSISLPLILLPLFEK